MLRDIDEGKPVKIVVADYSYGQDEQLFESAFGLNVLVEVDDGVADYDETIDYYLTYCRFGERYLDILKRLSKEVPVGDPMNLRREIPLLVDSSNNVLSIQGNPVTERSWWNVYLQEYSDSTTQFADQTATRGTRMHLAFYQDSDQDYYTDRAEWKIGTDPNDPESHPSPILIAGKIQEESGGKQVIKLKFTNAGNYDAYGIEAVLYSPDNTSTIIDSLIGGGGRIEAGRTFEPNDTFIFTPNISEYNEPVTLVRYNDPQGDHSFVTRLKLADPNENIENKAGEMIWEPKMTIETNGEYTYNQNNWLLLDYYNPDMTIHEANLLITYQDPNGNIISTTSVVVDLGNGKSSFLFWWKPSEYLPEDVIGKGFKVAAVLLDYQGIEIYDDVQKFKIVNYPVQKLINEFSDGLTKKEIIFTEPGTQVEYLKIPKDANITSAHLELSGHELSSNFPDSPWLEVGSEDGTREWSAEGAKLQEKVATLDELSDGATVKELVFDPCSSKVVYFKIPKNAEVLCASFMLENLASTGKSLLLNGQTVSLFGDQIYDFVELRNGSTIIVSPYNGNDGTGFLNLTALYRMTIDSTSKIEGNGSGFRGGGGGGTSGLGEPGGPGEGLGRGIQGPARAHAGGGAGYGGSGGHGENNPQVPLYANGGPAYGDANDQTVFMGSGGGGGAGSSSYNGKAGGNGGASIVLNSPVIVIKGGVRANGADGGGGSGNSGGGGGGSGGTVFLKGSFVDINSATIEAKGGNGGNPVSGCHGGGGSGGRIKIF
jgi:hypothetical protein